MQNSYELSLRYAQEELRELLEQSAQIEKRIARLKLTIRGLQELCGADDTIDSTESEFKTISKTTPIKEMGLTDMVREILKMAQFPLTTADIKHGMIEAGLDVNSYSNILASINVILKRLIKQEEVKVMEMKDGNKTYNGYLYIPTQQQPLERFIQALGKTKSK